MKSIILSILFVCSAISFTDAELKCQAGQANVPNEWLDMKNGCVNKVRAQIQTEIDASMTYLSMAAYFSQDTVNRPGFAKFFYDSASEEREHATKLMEYLLMRGRLVDPITNLINVNAPTKTSWNSAVDALKDALRTEASVTKSIRNVIGKCENDNNDNDYHIVDYLTGVFLEEQYKGQRELAGKISTLEKMMATHGPLGEFLYDKKLL